MLRDLDEAHLTAHQGDPSLSARISTFDTARGLMREAPEAFDIHREPKHTLALYGARADDPSSFAAQCLVARRLVERGVRVVELFDVGSNSNWDSHTEIDDHVKLSRGVDRPLAALVKDLKRCGLLDETLIVGCSEFGRSPWQDLTPRGRAHHNACFTCFLAGGGVRGGLSFGRSDDYGNQRRRESRPCPRPARHDPAHHGARPHPTHLSLLGPRLPPDRRPRPGRARHPGVIVGRRRRASDACDSAWRSCRQSGRFTPPRSASRRARCRIGCPLAAGDVEFVRTGARWPDQKLWLIAFCAILAGCQGVSVWRVVSGPWVEPAAFRARLGAGGSALVLRIPKARAACSQRRANHAAALGAENASTELAARYELDAIANAAAALAVLPPASGPAGTGEARQARDLYNAALEDVLRLTGGRKIRPDDTWHVRLAALGIQVVTQGEGGDCALCPQAVRRAPLRARLRRAWDGAPVSDRRTRRSADRRPRFQGTETRASRGHGAIPDAPRGLSGHGGPARRPIRWRHRHAGGLMGIPAGAPRPACRPAG